MAGEVSLPLAAALTIFTILFSAGIAWGVMRMQLIALEKASALAFLNIEKVNAAAFASVEKKQDSLDRDLREGFNRIAALERDAVTQEAFREFRLEMVAEFKELRKLIETLRPKPRSKPDE